MVLLMKNWILPHEHSYGYGGGESYMKTVFNVTENHSQYAEITRTGIVIQSTFEPYSCFLLPSQGKDVLFTNYQGEWRQLDEDFKKHLVILIEDVLRPSNLVIKKIDGNELIAQEFSLIVKNYFELMDKNPQNSIVDSVDS